MSHELKTPLNAIIGFSDFLKESAETLEAAQVREYAGLIHQGGHNLLRMIVQILDLTKIAAGRYDLNRMQIDAGAILWATKGEFDARAASKSIVIDADACPIGVPVMADENALRTICAQLLENAVHFTPQGGRIGLHATTDGATVRLAIADNGPGVAAEDLERILMPFEQSNRGGATQHAYGAGLGLTLVKELAELNGGQLRLVSAPGEGFEATVELPAGV